MPNIPNKSVDMILCDLPYGTTRNKLDVKLPFEPLWEQYTRIIKNNGCIALFGQGIFYIDIINSNRNMFKYDLVWDKVLKSGFLNANRMPLRQHEQIAIFYRKPPTYNPQFTYGQPLHSKGTAYKERDAVNQNYNQFNITDDTRSGSKEKYPSSIIKFQKPHPSISCHPTEKPILLLEYLIKTYTNEGETILDNCMGSGSTGIAALNTKRKFIGIEKHEPYFAIAKSRIEGSQNAC